MVEFPTTLKVLSRVMDITCNVVEHTQELWNQTWVQVPAPPLSICVICEIYSTFLTLSFHISEIRMATTTSWDYCKNSRR